MAEASRGVDEQVATAARQEPATYRHYQQQLLESEIPRAAMVLLVISVFFVLAACVLSWQRTRNEWPWMAVLVITPIACLLAVRTGLASGVPHRVALLTDATYTSGIAAGLLFPGTPTSGTALLVSVKLLAAAMLLPWHPLAQVASAAMTLALYWGAGWYTHRFLWESNDLPHQLMGPVFAAVISVAAAMRAEHLRRRLFEESLAAQRQAQVNAQFAAILSHELRNLLGAILGYAEMASDGATGTVDRERLREWAERQRALARQGLEAIQVALDLSRGGTLLAVKREDPLDKVWEELRQEYALRDRSPTVALSWDVSPDLPAVNVDGTKLKMIVRNLVDNALKFTPQGEVRVRVRATLDDLLLEVCDTGIGIPPEQQPFIFDPFRQVNASRSTQGVGLGLFITSRLVELMGGSIRVDSNPGKGTCFEVQVPFVLPARTSAPSHQ